MSNTGVSSGAPGPVDVAPPPPPPPPEEPRPAEPLIERPSQPTPIPSVAPPHAAPPRKRPLWLNIIVGVFVFWLIGHAVLVRFAVDRVWLATVLAFLPRWLAVVPAPIVLALIAWKRDLRGAALVAVGLVLQLFWGGGLRLSLFKSAPIEGRSLRVATQNAERVPFESGWLDKLAHDEHADVILVQECPISTDPDHEGPSPLADFNWATDINTCIFSRYPITKRDARDRHDVWDRGGSGAIALYQVEAPFGTFYIQNVHFMTARDGLEGLHHSYFGGIDTMRENSDARRFESGVAREWAKRAEGPLVVAGDFNMPVESAIFRDTWDELESGFDQCGNGFGYSKETVVKGIEYGTRIDHVLYDSAWKCSSAHLGPHIGSDHRAMVVDLSLK